SGLRIKLRKQSCVTSSAISIEPNNRYAKRKIGSRYRSYNSRKAAWSPSPAFSSKSSSVILSGNQALDPAGLAPACVLPITGKRIRSEGKKLARTAKYLEFRPNINRTSRTSTYFLHLSRVIGRIPFVNQGLGC